MLRALKRKLYRTWLLEGPMGTIKKIANYPRSVARDFCGAKAECGSSQVRSRI